MLPPLSRGDLDQKRKNGVLVQGGTEVRGMRIEVGRSRSLSPLLVLSLVFTKNVDAERRNEEPLLTLFPRTGPRSWTKDEGRVFVLFSEDGGR